MCDSNSFVIEITIKNSMIGRSSNDTKVAATIPIQVQVLGTISSILSVLRATLERILIIEE